MNAPRIVLVHLIANGDCLMATAIARQIKADFPGCHLTWAVSCKCRQIIENNPDVDAIWSVEANHPKETIWDIWRRVKAEAEALRASGEMDHIFYTQVYPDNASNFDGTTRSSIFRNYPRPLTVPVTPVLRLSDAEVAHARRFAEEGELSRYRHVILFECAPGSGQSSLTPAKALDVASRLVARHDDVLVILSSHIPVVSSSPRILDASHLSLRENVALSHFCTLLVGCSSGISWLLTCDSAKLLPTVQFLNRGARGVSFASMAYDFQHWGLNAGHIIESSVEGGELQAEIISRAMMDFVSARGACQEIFRPVFWDFLLFFDYRSPRRWFNVFRTCRLFVRRNHVTWRDVFRLDQLWGAVRELWRAFSRCFQER